MEIMAAVFDIDCDFCSVSDSGGVSTSSEVVSSSTSKTTSDSVVVLELHSFALWQG